MPHPAAFDEPSLLRHCTIHRGRAGGPGGQHRNKVETAVEIRHDPTGIEGSASERRSQEENRRQALFRLRLNLALKWRQELSDPLLPSDLWRQRCQGSTIRVNPRHRDFPAILAEALDVIAVRSFDIKTAALVLDCSASQLVKLLKVDPRALAWVNDQRHQRGMHPLR